MEQGILICAATMPELLDEIITAGEIETVSAEISAVAADIALFAAQLANMDAARLAAATAGVLALADKVIAQERNAEAQAAAFLAQVVASHRRPRQ